MKRVFAVFMVLVIALSLGSVSVTASTADIANKSLISIEPFWVNASTIDLGITYSGTTASCTGRIKGYSDVNKITATFTLKKVNSNGTTTTVKTWSGLSSSTSSLNFSETYSTVSKGTTYRLEVSATLTTTSGVKETVSDSANFTY